MHKAQPELHRDVDTPGNPWSLAGTGRCTPKTATLPSKAAAPAWVWGIRHLLHLLHLPAAKQVSPGPRGGSGTSKVALRMDRPLLPSPNICADVNRRGRARFSIRKAKG